MFEPKPLPNPVEADAALLLPNSELPVVVAEPKPVDGLLAPKSEVGLLVLELNAVPGEDDVSRVLGCSLRRSRDDHGHEDMTTMSWSKL